MDGGLSGADTDEPNELALPCVFPTASTGLGEWALSPAVVAAPDVTVAVLSGGPVVSTGILAEPEATVAKRGEVTAGDRCTGCTG